MKNKLNKKNTTLTQIGEFIFIVTFIIFTGAVIYFLSKGFGTSEIKLEVTGLYKDDQANAIKAIADATTSRINNIIAATAIFFTVIVASVSMFQFIKSKEINNLTNKIEEKFNDMECKLRLSNVENRIFIKILRIIDLEKNGDLDSNNRIISLGTEILGLLEENPDFKLDDRQMNGLYFNLGRAYSKINPNLAIHHFKKSFEYYKDSDNQHLARIELAKVYFYSKGNTINALDQIKEAIVLDKGSSIESLNKPYNGLNTFFDDIAKISDEVFKELNDLIAS